VLEMMVGRAMAEVCLMLCILARVLWWTVTDFVRLLISLLAR
jgi:hypothetical protein